LQSVRLSARKIGALLLTAGACAAAPVGSAQAQIAFAPCGDSNNFACGHLTVPLDPSGGAPGTLTLAMRRHRAPIEGSNSAVIALAGGPGQAAIPLTEAFLELLGPIVATRDLIVFDQRGTGLSHALSCLPPKHRGKARPTLAQEVSTCARKLGLGRAFYTTPDSVADIEAIRRAGGYDKLVLYGTSYGTKVAEQYAQDYPAHVKALVLDSVVTPNGPDPLNRSTFAAVPRILDQLCGYRECVHITPHPVSDLAKVVGRARHRPILGRVIDGRGHGHREPISSDDLVGLLLDGDFDPLLRAEFVPAVRAAARGDDAMLARLLARVEGPEEGGGGGGGTDGTLYLTTTCEEEPFGWSRAASPKARLSEATAQLDGLPASVFSPFTAANALDLSALRTCASWPYSTPAPPVVEAPLPNVPTLVLSGASDLRTPTGNAREVAGQIPDAQLLVVPYAGHSVLTDEPTSCGTDALQAFFAGHPIKPCRAMPPPPILKLPPLPPTRLDAVTPSRGYHGLPGRTLHSVLLTLTDFARQFFLALLESLGSGALFREPSVSGGGLRAGWYRFHGGRVVMHGYSYIPGLTISGSLSSGHVTLVVGGSAAAHGTLREDRHEALVGSLGGQPVRLPPHAPGTPAGKAAATTSPRRTLDAPTIRALARASLILQALPNGTVDVAELPHLLASLRAAELSFPR
jgi:pimeloyl-ACP methyl ester carboxylesterase